MKYWNFAVSKRIKLLNWCVQKIQDQKKVKIVKFRSWGTRWTQTWHFHVLLKHVYHSENVKQLIYSCYAAIYKWIIHSAWIFIFTQKKPTTAACTNLLRFSNLSSDNLQLVPLLDHLVCSHYPVASYNLALRISDYLLRYHH